MTAGTRTIAVISQVKAGHIPTYHRLYVAQFATYGCQVMSIEPDVGRGLLARLGRQWDRSPWLLSARVWRRAASRLRAEERRTGIRANAAFLVYLDQGFLTETVAPSWIDRWFPWNWSGVVTAPRAVRGLTEPFAGRERVLTVRHCRAVVVTDEAFVAPCRSTWPGREVIAMPEIADLSPPSTTPAVRALKEFAGGRRLVGLVGVISEKKNVEPFLALARRAQAELPDVAFFLAGDFSANACPAPERRRLQAVLGNRPPNCALFDQPLEDGPEFNAFVAACDVVWVAYRNVFYKSNVLTKAAHFRKPALVSPGSIMAEHTASFALGEIVDATNVEGCIEALRRLLQPAPRPRRYEAFEELNGPERLKQTAGAVADGLFGKGSHDEAR